MDLPDLSTGTVHSQTSRQENTEKPIANATIMRPSIEPVALAALAAAHWATSQVATEAGLETGAPREQETPSELHNSAESGGGNLHMRSEEDN